MKKVFSISLVMLMALCVFISCNPSSGVEDNVSVTLNAKNGEIDLEKENLSWKYTAVKSDGLDPKDGETEEEKSLNDGKTDSLSQGEWNFTLYGYKGSNLVCTGSVEKVEITKSNNTVDIDVSLLQKAEGTIVVSDDVAIKSTDGKTTYSLSEGYTMTLVISDKDGNVVTRKEYHSKAVFNTDSQTVKSGAYSITVTFSKDDVTATYTKNINVYDYLSTTISGSLNGVIIKADADKGGTEATTVISEDVFVTKTDEDGNETIENAEIVEVIAPISAVEETEDESASTTTVAFPAGSLKKTTSEETTEAVTLTVATATATAASASTSDYSTKITTTDAAVVAGFEFNLSGADSSDLTSTQTTEDGKEEKVGVTVTTYVAKGLGTKDNLKIEYIGENEGKDPEIVSYDNTTGKLVFTVYHFSKYAIVSTKVVAANSDGRMYETFADAVEKAGNGTTVTLLRNASWTGSTPISIGKTLTIDLNGKTLELKNSLSDIGSNYNNTSATAVTLPGADRAYTVTIKNGTVTGSAGSNMFTLNTNTGLVLEKVIMNVECARAIQIYKYSQNATVGVKGCEFNVKGYYAVATNADVAGANNAEGVAEGTYSRNNTISIENSEIEVTYTDGDCTGLLLNVPGNVTIKGSTVKGGRQGAILRGGTYTISDSTFEYTTNNSGNSAYESNDWKDGNNVPNAAIVIGNRGTSAYKYPTTVTLSGNINLKVPASSEELTSNHLYVYQASSDYAVTVKGNLKSGWIVNTDVNGAHFSGCSTWDGTVETTWYNANQTEFTLTTASQLAGLATLVNKGTDFSGKTVYLANDINLNQIQWTPIGLYDPNDGNNENFKKTLFSGTFDGNGHLVKNLKFDGENIETVAFFGYVKGIVKNFTLYGEIEAKSGAGVVGGLERGGKIEDVTSYVNVTCSEKAAGIVLATKDKQKITDGKWTISKCKNYGTISSGSACGGILSWSDMYETEITDCENHGDITSTGTEDSAFAGGIVGMGKTLVITDCKNTGAVKAESGAAGGIVGAVMYKNNASTCTVSECGNEGTVVGYSGNETVSDESVSYTKAGEMIGYVESVDPETRIKIENCTIANNKKSVGAVFKYEDKKWTLVSIESWPKAD